MSQLNRVVGQAHWRITVDGKRIEGKYSSLYMAEKAVRVFRHFSTTQVFGIDIVVDTEPGCQLRENGRFSKKHREAQVA